MKTYAKLTPRHSSALPVDECFPDTLANRAGIGLRIPHHGPIMERGTSAGWLEVHPENYIDHAIYAEELEVIRCDHALSFHSVGLSVGSVDGLDKSYVRELAKLIQRFQPALVSDHLSWSRSAGIQLPDLMPLPCTDEAFEVVARNVDQCQAMLRRRMLLENPSTYLSLWSQPDEEAQFLAALVARTECAILLDINNIYVSARNRGMNPSTLLAPYLALIPHEAIAEIHLAGHSVYTARSGVDVRIDDHGSPVFSQVWDLFEEAIRILGPRPTLIEWDTNLPPLEVLEIEAATAQYILDCTARNRDRHASLS